MNIFGKTIVLRAIESQDLPFYKENINDPDIEKMVGGWSFPVSTKAQEAWYNKIVNDRSNLRFSITLADQDIPLGMVNLVDIDWKSGVAFSGIKLFNNAPKGAGIGFDTVMTVMRYAFDELRLNRLEGTILEFNEASMRLYKKCGWKKEGVRRQSQYQMGKYYDEFFVAILKDEFEEIRDVYDY